MTDRYIPDEYQDISKGDEFYVENYSRHARVPFSGPYKVTRVTATQFCLNGQRYMRTTGYEVGRGGYGGGCAKPATPEYTANVNEVLATHKAEEDLKRAKLDAEELERRERYGAFGIDDDDVQKLLGQIRTQIEFARKEMKSFLKMAGKASCNKPHELNREINNWGAGEKFARAVYFRDMGTDLHESLVKLYNAFYRGHKIKYRLGDLEVLYYNGDSVTEAVDVLRAAVKVARRKAETEYFNHQYDDDDQEMRAEWINVLRSVDRMDCDYPSIRAIVEESK